MNHLRNHQKNKKNKKGERSYLEETTNLWNSQERGYNINHKPWHMKCSNLFFLIMLALRLTSIYIIG